MGVKVILTREAFDDLEHITRHLAQSDSAFAEQYSNELMDFTLSLSSFPEMGRIVPEFHRKKIRELIRNPYRIIYRLNTKQKLIEVLRFWHSARGTPHFNL